MSGFEPAPQFTPRGDLQLPNFGYNGHGDPIPFQTNARGDLVLPNHGYTPKGDPILLPTNPVTGDRLVSPQPVGPPDVPDAIKARYAEEQAAARRPRAETGELVLGELTTANAVDYLQERNRRAAQAVAPVVVTAAVATTAERRKPIWNGYADFKAFQRHGLVELETGKDPETGRQVAADIVRTAEEAERWRGLHLTTAQRRELGYEYRADGETVSRNELEAAQWRIEHAAPEDAEEHQHFLQVLELFRNGPTQGNIWQSSREASLNA